MYGAERQTPATNRMGFPLRRLHPEVHRHDSLRDSPEFSRVDRLLAANEEPPLGAHLVTPRFAYSHHGVYVGGGAVVHYAAFAKLWALDRWRKFLSQALLTDMRYGCDPHESLISTALR